MLARLRAAGKDAHHITAYRKALAQYDTLSPKAFRAWLEEMCAFPKAAAAE